MPLIELQTSTGPGSFNYTISTPKDASATAIVQGTPTLILLHPVYVAVHIFHPIFADPRLRQFNLVTLDLRGHGATTAKAEDTYTQQTAACDGLGLMDALNISACHVMGVSMGACIALQMAILAPERVLSLFMLSPLPLKEPAEVVEGRQEIYDCWIRAFADPNKVDEVALADTLTGSRQLAYNNTESPLSRAVHTRSVAFAMRNWGRGNFGAFHTVTVKFFLNRFPHPVSTLSRIRSPISLVHCSEDIAYPVDYSEELLELLRHADLDAKLYSIPGAPHFGNVTHFERYAATRSLPLVP
ncbi:Alpha/Beta hydrolase protein [Mycena epipterygia]|nr:Alpha/Beta hydrolase protein [Mycena epipterygia]